jgi:hypothetical protein
MHQRAEQHRKRINGQISVLFEVVSDIVEIDAEHVGGDRYRILSLQPSDEIWRFGFNEIVRCERKLLSGENCLVAAN